MLVGERKFGENIHTGAPNPHMRMQPREVSRGQSRERSTGMRTRSISSMKQKIYHPRGSPERDSNASPTRPTMMERLDMH